MKSLKFQEIVMKFKYIISQILNAFVISFKDFNFEKHLILLGRDRMHLEFDKVISRPATYLNVL